MRALAIRRTVSIFVCFISIAAALSGDAASQQSSSRPVVTGRQYEAWQTELSNWGRWGKDDQLGTLNLMTPAKRRAALPTDPASPRAAASHSRRSHIASCSCTR